MSKYAMERRQKGFTLVEIAIVLVIIGLLLGGVLKGQELINSAKVKNIANDFRNVSLFIYGYQDKYRALPGDDANVATHLGIAAKAGPAGATLGNGIINGNWWDSTDPATSEAELFWQHIRFAGLSTGSTNVSEDTYYPRNAEGGRIGVESNIAATAYITGIQGAYLVCQRGVMGRFAMQLDITMDDGDTATGSMRTVANDAVARPSAVVPTADARANADTPYTVCLGI